MRIQICQFHGTRLRDGTPVITVGGKKLDPSHYGGTRFDWGSEIGNTADTTALAMLLEFSGDLNWALRHYKEFRRRVVSGFAEGDWRFGLRDGNSSNDTALIESGDYLPMFGIFEGHLAKSDIPGATLPKPAQAASVPPRRPRVHYYRLERPDCGECGCPADRSDIKLVTYSIQAQDGKWVRSAALCDPRDPASRKAGRDLAASRARGYLTWPMRTDCPLYPPGTMIFKNLEYLKAEEELIREAENNVDLSRSARSRFYHDVFDLNISEEILERAARYTTRLPKRTESPWVEPLTRMMGPVVRMMGLGEMVSEFYHPTEGFVVVNVHAHDSQAHSADPDFAENFNSTGKDPI